MSLCSALLPFGIPECQPLLPKSTHNHFTLTDLVKPGGPVVRVAFTALTGHQVVGRVKPDR